MYEFFKGWAETGADLSFLYGTNVACSNETRLFRCLSKTILASIPIDVKNHFGEKRLLSAFELYQRAMIAQQPFYSGEKN